MNSRFRFASAAGFALLVACSGSDGTSLPEGNPQGDGGGNNGNGNGNNGNGNNGGGDEGGIVVNPPGGGSGCGGSFLASPEDPGARGPWAVGAKTVTIASLTTEIWYPAKPGSDAGKSKAQYDVREHLPDADAKKIPDSENPLQDCDCVRDLPLDEAHGPYPLVLFVHGTAAFRTQSLTFVTHWASRGFIVVASDHPGLELKDILAGGFGGGGGGNQSGDAEKVLDALNTPTGDLAFLANHLDTKHVGLAGHSAGANAIAGFGGRAGVEVLIPMAGGGTKAGSALKSTLVMGGKEDGIARYSRTVSGYDGSPKKKRLVGVDKAGHLAFSDLCFIGRDKGGILKIAQNGVNVNPLVATLARDGCKPEQLSAEDGWKIVNYAATAALEETLRCSPSSTTKLAATKSLPNVSEFKEDL